MARESRHLAAALLAALPGVTAGPVFTRLVTSPPVVYAKHRQGETAGLWFVTGDAGAGPVFVCDGMYEDVADWLIGHLQGWPLPGPPRE